MPKQVTQNKPKLAVDQAAFPSDMAIQQLFAIIQPDGMLPSSWERNTSCKNGFRSPRNQEPMGRHKTLFAPGENRFRQYGRRRLFQNPLPPPGSPLPFLR